MSDDDELLGPTNHGHMTSQLIRFALWAYCRGGIPTIDAIRARFSVSRATAYRWRRVFIDEKDGGFAG